MQPAVKCSVRCMMHVHKRADTHSCARTQGNLCPFQASHDGKNSARHCSFIWRCTPRLLLICLLPRVHILPASFSRARDIRPLRQQVRGHWSPNCSLSGPKAADKGGHWPHPFPDTPRAGIHGSSHGRRGSDVWRCCPGVTFVCAFFVLGVVD